jgi:hypothetical protein
MIVNENNAVEDKFGNMIKDRQFINGNFMENRNEYKIYKIKIRIIDKNAG